MEKRFKYILGVSEELTTCQKLCIDGDGRGIVEEYWVVSYEVWQLYWQTCFRQTWSTTLIRDLDNGEQKFNESLVDDEI